MRARCAPSAPAAGTTPPPPSATGGSPMNPWRKVPMPRDDRTSVVVLTHNRAAELERCVQQLQTLPERPPLIVVDNASTDDTAPRVVRSFPQVELVSCAANRGAAGRNAGVARAETRYVAFC